MDIRSHPMRRRAFLAAGGGLGALLAGCGPEREAVGPAPGAAGRPLAAPAFVRSAGSVVATEALSDPAIEVALGNAPPVDPYAPLGGALRAIAGGQDARALVMVVGDSHAAGPVLAERLRELFQARFGAAGPGRYAPGKSQPFFNPSGVRLAQSGEWVASSALRGPPTRMFGLAGYNLSGERAGDWISLRANDMDGFDRVHVAMRRTPDGGSFRVRLDGEEAGLVSTRSAAADAFVLRLDARERRRELAIELAGDGPVELLGWGVDRRGRGVLVEAFGIPGATISSLDNRAADAVARELAAATPALLVLEFGTNEATSRDLDAATYAAMLSRHVARLRAMLPRTGIMLMAAPDAARPARRGGSACGGRLSPLPALAAVRAAQREVARVERVGLFDWGAEVTRGMCNLPAMARGATPLMRTDLVHFTPAGYRLTAELLFAHMLRGAKMEAQGA